MHKSKSPTPVRLLLAVLALFAFGAVSLHAEDVFVTSMIGTANVGACPPSCVSGSVSASGSSAVSTVSPVPVIPAASRKARYGISTGCGWSVTPTDIAQGGYTFHKCGALNSLYKVYITKGGAIGASASASVVATITVDAATTLFAPTDTGGTTPLASLDTTAFQRAQPNDAWVPVCIISNTTPNPTVTFIHSSGTMTSTSGERWYMDAVRFQLISDPCADVTPQINATGPLAAGQTFVNVPVSAGATNVTVYANSVQIGTTNYAAGFAAGTVQVPTSALVKGNGITATQIKLNPAGDPCPSAPGAAAIVGGGPNASLAFFASVWKTPALTGPIGADGAVVGYAYFMPCTALNYGQPPVGGLTNVASGCWQTITFNPRVDPAMEYNGGGLADFTTDAFCSLDGLAITQVNPDTGPYDIYVDQIMNGDVVVEDFESYAADSVSTFVAPGATTPAVPDPNITFLPPNSSTISTDNAYDGTKSCRIKWQWTTAGGRYARVQSSGASGGKKWPQLDTTKTISFKILVLPVGSTTGTKFNGEVGAITNTTPIYQGGTAELGVTVTGSGSYTYDWSVFNTEYSTWDSLGVTTRTCQLNPVPNAASTRYKVSVSDGGCAKTAEISLTTPVALPVITNQPASIVVQVGSPANTCVGATPTDPLGGAVQYYQWEKADETGTNWNYVVSSLTAICLSEGIPTAQFSDTGSYRMLVQGVNGQVFSRTISLQVVPADVAVGNGDGLRGDYFNLASWSDTIGAAFANNRSWAGTPALTEVDSNVDFVWGSASPGAGVNADKFGVRWYGQIQPLTSDTYDFNLYCGDGARMWIDKQLVINSWSNQYATTHSASLALTSAKHDILIEYFESTQSATAQLLWNDNGAIISNSCTVPIQQLFANKSTWTPASVALDLPANGSSLTLPGTVSLSATVTTNDAIVKSVRFYTNNVAVATVTTAPFNYTWTPPAAGTYNVSASVIYNESAFADSTATNTVTVNAVVAAPVTITNLIGTTLTYGGGDGSQFILLQSATANAAMSSWTTTGLTNTATPGTFTVPGPGYYRIESK